MNCYQNWYENLTEFSDVITDIRELLLPQEDTLLIADEFGIKPPRNSKPRRAYCNDNGFFIDN